MTVNADNIIEFTILTVSRYKIMYITSNIAAMNANRNLIIIQNNKAKTMEKLSSGYRINRAADEAAGLAISEKIKYQIYAHSKQYEMYEMEFH